MFHTKLEVNHLCTVKRQHSGTYLPGLRADATWFARARRRFRTWTQISRHHPKCIEYFKSATGVRRERKRHAWSPHAYIIHPFSAFRIYYEMYMIVVYLVAILSHSCDFTFKDDSSVLQTYEISCVFCIADVVLTFLTGYVHEATRTVVLEPRKIAWRYCKSMFLFTDLLAFAPVNFPLRLLYEDDDVDVALSMVRMVGYVRVYTINKYVINTAEYYGFKTNKLFQIVRHVGSLFLVVNCFNSLHFTTPLTYIMCKSTTLESKSWLRVLRLISQRRKRYVTAMLLTSGLVLGASKSTSSPDVWVELCLHIITYVFGKFYALFLTVVMLHMLMSSRNLEIKYDQVMDQLEEYMTHKDLPQRMRKRLRMYYDYKYQKKFFRERTIGGILSDGLNREVKIHVCRKFISNVGLLADMSTKTVSDILEYLKSEVYLPNDTIIKAGEPGDCMYFLSSGTVAVYTPTGKELCHLQDGAYFGEISLIMKDQLRTANVYAVEICEVYSLARRHFKRFFLKNEELYGKLYQKAEDRLEMLTALEEYHRYAKWR